MIRNPDKNGQPVTVFIGDRDVYDDKLFKAVPIKKGIKFPKFFSYIALFTPSKT